MKCFIVFSVVAICALGGDAFFLGHGKSKGGSVSQADSSASAFSESDFSESSAGASAGSSSGFGGHGHGSSGGGGGGLGGIGNILAIPIQIKTKLIQAKRAKLNQAFDAIEGALGKFSNLGGGGGGGHSSGGFGGGHGNLFGGSSGSSSSAGSGASSGSISGNGGYSYQAPAQSYQPQQSFQPQQSYQPQQVQSFHPQPAPQANYQQHPVVVHFYQVEVPTQQVQAQSHSSSFGQSAGGSFVAQQEQVATPAFVPEPIQAYRPEPVATPYHPEPVHQEYGPPPPSSYVPPPSGSFSSSGAVSQVSSQVQPQNSYLPPHQGCQDASHYH